MTLLTPSDTGITLAGGQSYPLTWSYSGEISNSLKLSYSTDGTNYSNTIASGESNDGTYTWTVPFYPGIDTKVKIEDTFYQKLLETSSGQFGAGVLSYAQVSGSGSSAKIALGNLSDWNTPDKGDYAFPVLADLDNDGDKDLLAGGWNYSVAYKNTGNANAPVWTEQADWALPYYTDGSCALADLDGDNDLDLMLGERMGNVYGYKNTGSVNNPIWTAQSSWNIASLGMNAIPTLADLDNDGLKDLLVGASDGICHAYKNTGSVNNPIWTAQSSWNISGFSVSVSPGLADLDNDGDIDVLVKLITSGMIYGYENTGGIGGPVWSPKTNWNRNADEMIGFGGLSLADLDNDGDQDLMFGSVDGRCYGAMNVGSAAAPSFYQWTSKSEWNLPDLGNTAMPVFADMDGDGDLDVLIRTVTGAVYGYENTGGTGSPVWS